MRRWFARQLMLRWWCFAANGWSETFDFCALPSALSRSWSNSPSAIADNGPSSKWYRRAKRWSALIFKRDLISPVLLFCDERLFNSIRNIAFCWSQVCSRARFTTTRRRLSWSWSEAIKMFELRIESYFFFIRHVRACSSPLTQWAAAGCLFPSSSYMTIQFE